MTKTRLLAALIMAPIAILTVLYLPTPVLAALSAVLFLVGRWWDTREPWLREIAEGEDALSALLAGLPAC